MKAAIVKPDALERMNSWDPAVFCDPNSYAEKKLELARKQQEQANKNLREGLARLKEAEATRIEMLANGEITPLAEEDKG